MYKPPFKNGQAADREFQVRQNLEGDDKGGYRLTHATALAFNPVKSDDWIDPSTKKHKYKDGHLWLCDRDRCMLLDKDGEILLAIGAPDAVTHGGRYDSYGRSGLDPHAPFNLLWPGGSIGFDTRTHQTLTVKLPPRGRCIPVAACGAHPRLAPRAEAAGDGSHGGGSSRKRHASKRSITNLNCSELNGTQYLRPHNGRALSAVSTSQSFVRRTGLESA